MEAVAWALAAGGLITLAVLFWMIYIGLKFLITLTEAAEKYLEEPDPPPAVPSSSPHSTWNIRRPE